MSDLLEQMVGEIAALRTRVNTLETREPAMPSSVVRRLLYNHLYAQDTVKDDFDASTLDAQWTWAGAPFATPGTISLSIASVLNIQDSSSVRAFMYQAGTFTGSQYARCDISLAPAGMQLGLRLDDGTDDNYVEWVLTAASLILHNTTSRVRAGGGGVTATTLGSRYMPGWALLQLAVSGTTWTNWTATYSIYHEIGRGRMSQGTSTGLTWTPTRKGIVLNCAATTSPGLIDWYN